ncbi:MAG: cytochrome c oxidase cbb3-type subunit 4 [Arenicella sp.]|jgi:cytochrome c oxidase cbb3-type subunit 4
MIGVINGFLTALLLVIFVAIWVWAWSAKNKQKFDAMAKLPLEDQPSDSGEHRHE